MANIAEEFERSARNRYSDKEQDDHFTRSGTDFSTAVALVNQCPELKLLPHSVARASFRAGYSIPLELPKAKSKQ